MFVHAHMRGENKLQALKDTLTMVAYTVQMVENEKIFPKKSRWTFGNRLINLCIDSVTDIKNANKIVPKNAEQADKRLELQRNVLMCFNSLWAIMEIVKNTYNITNVKIETWSSLMLEADNMVSAWYRSDKQRYHKQFNSAE